MALVELSGLLFCSVYEFVVEEICVDIIVFFIIVIFLIDGCCDVFQDLFVEFMVDSIVLFWCLVLVVIVYQVMVICLMDILIYDSVFINVLIVIGFDFCQICIVNI